MPTPAAQVAFTEADEDNLPPGFDVQSKDVKPVDVDNDGDLDLVVAVEYRANWLLINQGEGRFDAPGDALPGADRDSEDVAVADFDGDGDIDIIFANEDDRFDELYVGNGVGQYIAADFGGDGQSNAVITQDINGDGTSDIMLGNRTGIAVWLGDGQGGFTERSDALLDHQTTSVQDLELGDVNLDGNLDLIVASDGDNALFLGDGSGRFSLLQDAIPIRQTTEQTREADFADIDGDGDLDLYFANVAFGGPGDARDRLLINDGTGRFAAAASSQLPIDDGSIMTMDVDFVDIEGDGDVDIALTGLTLSNGLAPAPFRVLLNDGNGKFEPPRDPLFARPVSMIGTDIEFADFDGDGMLDLYIANRAGRDRMFFGQ